MNSREKRIIIALMKKVDELKFKENSLQTKISDMKMKGKIIRDWIGFFLGLCLLVGVFIMWQGNVI